MTGLIYAAIVAAWAAYLVPLALRRHEERARARSARRFSTAMRVLSRHSDADPVRPLRPSPAPAAGPLPSRPRPSRAAARRAAARRRRVLSGLLVVGLAVAGFACFGVVPWWAVLIPLVLGLAFVAVCRRQVRREDEAYWADAVARLPEVSRGARVQATRAGLGDEPNDEPTVVLRSPVAEAVEPPKQVVAVAVPTSDGGSLWDPLPITLPTYVTKPSAPRTIRTVDLVRPVPPVPVPSDAADEVEAEPRQAVGQ